MAAYKCALFKVCRICYSVIDFIVNNMGEKDIEENMWTNRGEWTVGK